MSHRFSVCSRSSLNATPQVHAYRQSSSPHICPTPRQVPPPSYICYRCRVPGHYFKDCTNEKIDDTPSGLPYELNWECPECFNDNWPRREKCNRCQALLPLMRPSFAAKWP